MGAYVNPPDMEKELWLKQNGKLISVLDIEDAPSYDLFEKGTMPVVLVDNGPFTAAAIAFCKEEYQEFTNPKDIRPKNLYKVSIEKLLKVSNLKDYL